MDCGLLELQTCDFRRPHKKKPIRVKSHNLGVPFTPPLQEMTIPENRCCRTYIVASAVWCVASCLNHTSSKFTLISSHLGQKKSVIIHLQRLPLTVMGSPRSFSKTRTNNTAGPKSTAKTNFFWIQFHLVNLMQSMIINLKVLGQLNLVNVGSSPDIKFINFKSAKGCVLVQGQELTASDSPAHFHRPQRCSRLI